jgi:thiol-disulfide isomerase/thioredoxin
MRFDGAMPGVIPAGEQHAKSDLTVYENAMAIVETDGEPSLVQFGELIRVGDVWKLTQIPQMLKGDSIQVTQGGLLMQPAIGGGAVAAAPSAMNSTMQKLIAQLQELDEKSPAPTSSRSVISKFHDDRTDLLQRLIDASESDSEREQWIRQMADSIAAAVQGGTYTDGLTRLTKLEREVSKSSTDSPTLAYITYRKLLAEYSQKLQTGDPNEGGAEQEWWLKELAAFVEKFPKSDDAAEAMIQLANTNEFLGKLADARQWYVRVTQEHPNSEAKDRAEGALSRIDLKGKTLTLSGPGIDRGTIDVADYRGKVILVYYWATWCGPCTEDVPELRALYDQYRSKGFEIIGVNIDMTSEGVRQYLTQHKVTWPQIHQDGGFDSPPARSYGIILPPTVFLVDRSGRVVDTNLTLADLKAQLPKLLDKK